MIDNVISENSHDSGLMRLQRLQIFDEEQKAQVASILSEYDPSSLTVADTGLIIQAFIKAGIEPGDALFEAIMRAGFDQSGTKLILPMVLAWKAK